MRARLGTKAAVKKRGNKTPVTYILTTISFGRFPNNALFYLILVVVT
jgi:hypothetical protein